MNQIVNIDAHDEHMEQIASALTNGLIVVDSAGRIVWMDNATREIINGGLQHLSLPLARTDMAGVDCFFSTVDRSGHVRDIAHHRREAQGLAAG